MKNSMKIYLLLFIQLALLIGCAGSEDNKNVEDQIAAIRNMQNTYGRAGSEGDLDLFMSVWTDDAIRMEAGFNAIVGKEQIREHFRPMFEQYDMDINMIGESKIEVSGDIAFSYANSIVSMTPKGGDTIINLDLKVLEIYKEQPDGTWKVYIGCVTENPNWGHQTLSPDLQIEESTTDPKL